jgi:hypothetical protein
MYGMMRPSAKHQVRTKKKKTKMFNKGDAVSVLDEAINGVVISTKGQSYY